MPRIAVVLNPHTAPKRGLLARLLFGGPKRAYRYDLFDFCNNCYPPDSEDLARMAGVTVEAARTAIRAANFEGSFHEDYEDDDYTCCLCGRTLGSEDN
jgi:hypothetical protein